MMPIRDCMSSSPYCPDDKYEEFHDPVLSRENQSEKKASAHNWMPKHRLENQHGEHNGKIAKFAESVHVLKAKVTHH
ncbi:MAG: hypothetical protein KA282_01610 [Clostridia bacterium]|nr:hypothetical protein [Clostridia bacterium]